MYLSQVSMGNRRFAHTKIEIRSAYILPFRDHTCGTIFYTGYVVVIGSVFSPKLLA